MRRCLRGLGAERGQATVELIALIPVVVAVGVAAFCVLAAGRARELAGNAAEAGAIAMIHGADPRAGARAVVPEADRGAVRVAVRGRRVTVSIVPRVPVRALARGLTATSVADAGPEPPE